MIPLQTAEKRQRLRLGKKFIFHVPLLRERGIARSQKQHIQTITMTGSLKVTILRPWEVLEPKQTFIVFSAVLKHTRARKANKIKVRGADL